MECPLHKKLSRGLCRSCMTAICDDCYRSEDDYYCSEKCFKKSSRIDELIDYNIATTVDKRIIVDKEFIQTRLKILKSNGILWLLLLIGWSVAILNHKTKLDNYWLPVTIIFTFSSLFMVNVYKYTVYKKYARKS